MKITYTENKLKHNNNLLTQIQYLEDIYVYGKKRASKGDLGGYVESMECIGENVYISSCSKVIGTRPLNQCVILERSEIINSEVKESVVTNSKVVQSVIDDVKIKNSVCRNSIVEKSTINKDVIKYSKLIDIHSLDCSYTLSTIYSAYFEYSHFNNASFGKTNFISSVKNSKVYEI